MSRESLEKGSHQVHLVDAAKDSLSGDPVKMWPTPRTSDANGHSNPRIQKLRDGIPTPHQLREAVAVEVTGQLNPTWVEWLMGWPLGWTDLKPLAMDKYLQWLQLHGRS